MVGTEARGGGRRLSGGKVLKTAATVERKAAA